MAAPVPAPYANASATLRGLVGLGAQAWAGIKKQVDAELTGSPARRLLHTDVDVRDFGADPTGVADSAGAIQAALDSFTGPYDSSGGTVLVPAGNYLLSTPLVMNKASTLRGVQGHVNGNSRLTPAAGVIGVIMNAFGAQVRDLLISPAGRSGAGQHGIWMRHAGRVHRCAIQNCGGTGLKITSNEAYGLESVSNVNQWQASNLYINACQDAVYVSGGDANGGKMSASYLQGNFGWGIRDDGFLGNTWVGLLMEACNAGAIHVTQSAARSSFWGCYAESDCVQVILNAVSVLIGGNIGVPITGGVALTDGQWNTLSVKWAGDGGITGALESGGAVALSLTDTQSVHALGMAFDERTSLFKLSNPTAADAGLSLTAENAQTGVSVGTGSQGRALDPGVVRFGEVRGYYLGDQKICSGPAAPTTGDWLQGDIINDLNPTAGGTIGWVCTSPGTFGTYSEGLTSTSDAVRKHTVLSGASAVLVPGNVVQILSDVAHVQRQRPHRAGVTYQSGDYRTNDSGKMYLCVVGGLGGSTGPTGTGSGIADGAAQWDYVAPANRVLLLSGVVASGTRAISFPTPVFKTFGSIAP